MRAGVFQCDGGGLSPRDRLDRLAHALRGQSLDLVLCPELFLSGYNVGDDIARLAEPQHGPFMNAVAELAKASGTAIAYGYPERSDDHPWNTAAVVGADGALLANHRKLVIPPGPEAGRFRTGEGQTLFSLGGMTCALLICYDAEFGESARAAALAGAEVLLVPTALPSRWAVVARHLVPTRAFENGLWLLYANHAGVENGLEYNGGSCIVDPLGEITARAANTESLLTGTLDANSVRVARERLPYLADLPALTSRLRRPES